MKSLIRSIAILSVAASALSIPVSSAFAAGPPDSTTISRLFDQVKSHAADADYDADVLDSFRLSNIHWSTYGRTLNLFREHVNDLLEDYYQLQQVRDKATPAQRKAIDRLEPMLRDLATSLTDTIQTLNAHQLMVNMPGFQTQVRLDWVKIHAVYKFLCQCTNKNLLA